MDMVASYSQSVFQSGAAIRDYGMNTMGESGTHIIIMDLTEVQTGKESLQEILTDD
jgi:hypothetical protein